MSKVLPLNPFQYVREMCIDSPEAIARCWTSHVSGDPKLKRLSLGDLRLDIMLQVPTNQNFGVEECYLARFQIDKSVNQTRVLGESYIKEPTARPLLCC